MLTVIFKCDRCGLNRAKEIEKRLSNNTISCPKCNNAVKLIYKEKETSLGDIAQILEKIAGSLESIENQIERIIIPQIIKLEKDGVENLNNKANTKNNQKLAKDNNPLLYQEIIDFFARNGMVVNSTSSEQKIDPKLQTIANLMGNHYQVIKKLHESIKINLSSGKEFTLELNDDSGQKIGTITQLCSQLHQLKFLEEYHYEKRILKAKPSQNPKAINFLSGQWLELYLRKQMILCLRRARPQSKYAYLFNGKITLSNGENREIDIIFKTEKELFWFEAKTKDYQAHIHKYHHLASLLKLDRDHVYLILVSGPESTENLSSLYNLKVMTVEQFSQTFENYLKQKR